MFANGLVIFVRKRSYQLACPIVLSEQMITLILDVLPMMRPKILA